MSDDVSPALRALTRNRAHLRCEYCLLHEEDSWEPHQPDHIIARKHRGLTIAENLAWTCALCNVTKEVTLGRLTQIRTASCAYFIRGGIAGLTIFA